MRPYAEAVLGTYRELAQAGLPVPDLDNGSLASGWTRSPTARPTTSCRRRRTTARGARVAATHLAGHPGAGHAGVHHQPRRHPQVLAGAPAAQRPAPRTCWWPSTTSPAERAARPQDHRSRPMPGRRRALARALGGAADPAHAGGVPPGRRSTRWCRQRAGPSAARARATWPCGRARRRYLVGRRGLRRRGAGGRGAQERLGLPAGAAEGRRCLRRLDRHGSPAAPTDVHRQLGEVPRARGGRGQLRLGGPAARGRQGIPLGDYTALRQPLRQGPLGPGALQI